MQVVYKKKKHVSSFIRKPNLTRQYEWKTRTHALFLNPDKPRPVL